MLSFWRVGLLMACPLFLGVAAGLDASKNCHSIKPGMVPDAWCLKACNAIPPHCPATVCSCTTDSLGKNSQPASRTPEAEDETCHSTKPGLVPDAWCQKECNADPPHCPAAVCFCTTASLGKNTTA